MPLLRIICWVTIFLTRMIYTRFKLALRIEVVLVNLPIFCFVRKKKRTNSTLGLESNGLFYSVNLAHRINTLICSLNPAGKNVDIA